MTSLSKFFLPAFCAVLLLSTPALSLRAVAQTPALSQTEPSTITAEELQSRLKSKKTMLLLDVRQQEEYSAGHIDGAKLMPLNTLPDHLADLPKDSELVVYCKSGRRNTMAASFLLAQGYKNVVSLSGGFQEWSALQDAKKKEIQVCSASTGCQNR